MRTHALVRMLLVSKDMFLIMTLGSSLSHPIEIYQAIVTLTRSVMMIWCVIDGTDRSLFPAVRTSLRRMVRIMVCNLLCCTAIRMTFAPVRLHVGDVLVSVSIEIAMMMMMCADAVNGSPSHSLFFCPFLIVRQVIAIMTAIVSVTWSVFCGMGRNRMFLVVVAEGSVVMVTVPHSVVARSRCFIPLCWLQLLPLRF